MEAIVNGIKGWLGSLGNFTLDRVVPALVLLIAGIIVIRIIMFLVKKTLERSSMEKAAGCVSVEYIPPSPSRKSYTCSSGAIRSISSTGRPEYNLIIIS